MSDSATGQVIAGAAEIYEEFFVPALFRQWPPKVADAARIQRGDRVLDVACGTGILARAIAERVGSGGSVVGLDTNPVMLEVARRKAPEIEWRQAPAEALPFADQSFDAVVSQFGLMFFEDRKAAIREMARVLRPGGRLVVAVWAALETSPGYADLADILQELFGEEAANAIRAPFALGDTGTLRALFADAGIQNVEIANREGTVHFPSIEAWIYTEIKGWTLADRLNDEQYQLLLLEAERKLQPHVNSGDAVSFSAVANIVSATL
jgi:ubiquinone/menaquinone biosynthesis C-methylase UbiE